MKVTQERLPESRIQLDIEVDQERVDQSLEAAYRRLAPRARVPGFRPGKAPRPMVERHLGKDRLMTEALDKLVPDVYNEAIEKEDIDAIDQPHLDKIEFEPVRMKFIIPIRPTVDLGSYQSIRVEVNPVEVTDEAVAEQILLLRRRNAIHAPVERPVQWGDVLTADVKGTVEDETMIEDDAAEFVLREGEILLLPGLAETFIGMSKGDETTVELDVPEDFRAERFAGKKATFAITLTEVKEEQLPDEDDELAQQLDAEQFPTLATLKERIAADMRSQLQEAEDARLRTEAIAKLVEGANIDYPNVLVEREIDHMIQEQMGNDQRQYASYLARVGRSESQYREALRPTAQERVRRSLALSQLADAEAITVSDDDLDAEIERLVTPMGEQGAQLREMFGSDGGKASLRNTVLSRKTLDRLVAIVTDETAATTTADTPAEPPAEPAEEPAASGEDAE